MNKPKYLVRFTDCKYLPNFSNLENSSVKLGTFHYFRKIENDVRKDEIEGQSGVMLKVERPCNAYAKLFGKPVKEDLDEHGNFRKKTYIQLDGHSNEFNTWMFCVSRINDLKEIEALKKRFNCDCYYFITDYERFENSIQKSLANDLRKRPLNQNNEHRVIKGKTEKYFLSGKRKSIIYKNINKFMDLESETLTEFYSFSNSKKVNSDLWFYKPEAYKIEKECRFVFYSIYDNNHDKFFSINEEFVILNCDLNNAISLTPKELYYPSST